MKSEARNRTAQWCRVTRDCDTWAGLFSALALALLVAGVRGADAQDDSPVFQSIEQIETPAGPGAHEPSLAVHGGEVYLSWIEHEGDKTKVMMSFGAGQRWSDAISIREAGDLFVNWADFPSVAVFPNGTVAVHWLRKIGGSSFDYKVEIALSHDRGSTWSGPLSPHSDLSFAQHGFVSMLPRTDGRMTAVWLDGRAYDQTTDPAPDLPNAMQLRATSFTSEGETGKDVAIDLQTCSCCQTSLTATSDGTVLAAYRDRSDEEIRDISVARLTSEGWQDPILVHADGWEISGCPVNGPAISAHEDRVAVAWFTGAQDIPVVKLAFSDDAGLSFGAPSRLDLGDPVGRVDVEMLKDGTALVSWVEWIDRRETLMICRAEWENGCVARQVLATNDFDASVNFPDMVLIGDDVYIAWTQPGETGDSVAMRRATLSGRN